MNFREWYGLAPKKTYHCPLCGLETKGRKGVPMQCGTHKQNERGRYWKHLLRAAIDEARSG